MKHIFVFGLAVIFGSVSVKCQVISTFCGNGLTDYYGNGVSATAAQLNRPFAVTKDNAGNLYITDAGNGCIRKINAAGTISLFAGSPFFTGYAGDGGPALSAIISFPGGICLDHGGNIIFADVDNNCVRKIDTGGIITTIAGSPAVDTGGDGGPATLAGMNLPLGVITDISGNIFITDQGNGLIRKVTPAGIITTVAGSTSLGSGYNGDGIAATAAMLNDPLDVNFDKWGNMFISDSWNYRVRKVTPAGIITTVLSDSMITYFLPGGLSVDTLGNLYVSDQNSNNIWKLTPSGSYTKFAGNSSYSFSGDGGPATAAAFSSPMNLFYDKYANLYIADQFNNRIRMVNPYGVVNTVAGGTWTGTADGGPATSAEVFQPAALATDQSGSVFIADALNSRIRKVNTAGIISTIAGVAKLGFSGDNGPATAAASSEVLSLAFDNKGNLYLADCSNNCIRRIDTSGVITTFAGIPFNYGYSGDGGPATAALFNYPFQLAVDKWNNVYVGDDYNNVIRKIDTLGIISTFAGIDTAGFSGDGGPATAAKLNHPHGIAVDTNGTLYFCDAYNYRIRKISPTGIISTIAGTGTSGFSGDGGTATAAEISWIAGLFLDRYQHVYIADALNSRIRMIDSSGNIQTVVGNGTSGFSGDGGLPTTAEIFNPYGGLFDGSGNMFVADYNNNRVRYVRYNTDVSTVYPEADAFTVWPNPANDFLNIYVGNPSESECHIEVLDVLGHCLGQFEVLTNRAVKIPLSVNKGLYLVSYKCGSTTATKRVVVQ